MIHAFQFNGKSSLDFGVYISWDKNYDAPERDVELISVPGRSGDLIIDNGRFKNIEITYPAFIANGFEHKWSPFKAHMMKSATYERLEDTYDLEHFRKAVFLGATEPKVVDFRRKAAFKITFNCKPQRWLKSGEEAVTYTQGSVIYNPTEFPAKPLLMVIGYGQITIGDYRIVIAQHTGNRVWIDCELQDAWLETSNLKSVITLPDGEFPQIEPGAVSVSFPSTIQSVQITPRWWTV